MPIANILDMAHSYIMEGQLEKAQSLLSAAACDQVADHRRLCHYKALLEFYRGNLAGARDLMRQTLAKCGPNVNLERDLIVCLYHLQDMSGVREGLNKLELTLVEEENKLSNRSLFEGELMLGKFWEEEGRLAPAILFYEKALRRAQSTDQKLRATLQKARWLALYDPRNELSHLYRELISAPMDSLSQDAKVELQHSLMLIELRLIGSDHAWQRLEKVLPAIGALDQRLLVFDYVEGALAQDLVLHPQAKATAERFEELHPYEQFLKSLLREPSAAADQIQKLANLPAQMSWSSYLRLLCLVANAETTASVKKELHRKIQLIICGLDNRSQEIWGHRLKQALSAAAIKIELSMHARTITVQGKTMDLSKKKIGLQLLNGLIGKTHLTVDQAIALLWECDFSPEHYHRLRMGAHRLNALINEQAGVGKILEVDSQAVRLRPEVNLRTPEERLPLQVSF